MTPVLHINRQDGWTGRYSAFPRLALLADYRSECLARRGGEARIPPRLATARDCPALNRRHEAQAVARLGLPSLAAVAPALLAMASQKRGLRGACAGLTGLVYFLAGMPVIAQADLVPLKEQFGTEQLEFARSTGQLGHHVSKIEAKLHPRDIRDVGAFGLWATLAEHPVLGSWERLASPSPPPIPIDRHRMQDAARRAFGFWKVELP